MTKQVNPKVLIEVTLISSKIEYRRKKEMLNGKKDHLIEILEKIALNEPLPDEDINEFIKSLEYTFKKKLKETYNSIKNTNEIDNLPEKTKTDKVLKLLISYFKKFNINI